MLKPLYRRVEFLWVIIIHHYPNRIFQRHLRHQSPLLLSTLYKLIGRRNIGIIIQYRYAEILCKVFKTIAAARRTATVQQQRRNISVQIIYNMIKMLLIIYFHTVSFQDISDKYILPLNSSYGNIKSKKTTVLCKLPIENVLLLMYYINIVQLIISGAVLISLLFRKLR